MVGAGQSGRVDCMATTAPSPTITRQVDTSRQLSRQLSRQHHANSHANFNPSPPHASVPSVVPHQPGIRRGMNISYTSKPTPPSHSPHSAVPHQPGVWPLGARGTHDRKCGPNAPGQPRENDGMGGWGRESLGAWNKEAPKPPHQPHSGQRGRGEEGPGRGERGGFRSGRGQNFVSCESITPCLPICPPSSG